MEKWQIEIEINKLKAKLSETDYLAIKYAEGELTAIEFAEMKAKRKAWREEINAKQTLLKSVK